MARELFKEIVERRESVFPQLEVFLSSKPSPIPYRDIIIKHRSPKRPPSGISTFTGEFCMLDTHNLESNEGLSHSPSALQGNVQLSLLVWKLTQSSFRKVSEFKQHLIVAFQ